MDKHNKELLIPTPGRLKKQLRLIPIPWQLVSAAFILIALSFIPFALVSRARSTNSAKPRVHLFQDMDNQAKYKAQSFSPVFADGRSMRTPVRGTVARGEARLDDHYERGFTLKKVSEDAGETGEGKGGGNGGGNGGGWEITYFEDFPEQITVDEALIRRGQQRFNINCASCHGYDGYGQGPVTVRAEEIGAGWTPPTSMHAQTVVDRENGHLYNTIRNGIRSMPPYGSQIDVEDRWAIVAYIRALQLSQNAPLDDVPVEMRDKLR